MNVIGPYAIGFVAGIFVSPFISVYIFGRLMQRFARQAQMERTANDLEKRRAATDSGRDSQLPADMGPEARETNLFVIHPGKLETNRRQENRRKLAERLASGQHSGSMNESGSDSDQSRS